MINTLNLTNNYNMKNTIVLVTGTFIGADGSLGYKNNHEHALCVWIGPSVVRHDVGKLHIFIQRVDDNLGSTECEYASIATFKNNWKDIRLAENSGLDFGVALVCLQVGFKVCRYGWNGKAMWLYLVPGSTFEVAEGRPLATHLPVGESVTYQSHIDMRAADGTHFAWNPNCPDVIAHDWQIVE